MSEIPVDQVKAYLLNLQNTICDQLEQEDGGATFLQDEWLRPEGGGGRSRVLEGGAVFEKAGINFSDVQGASLPPSATATRPQPQSPGGSSSRE